jgi:hypothetical protein
MIGRRREAQLNVCASGRPSTCLSRRAGCCLWGRSAGAAWVRRRTRRTDVLKDFTVDNDFEYPR